MILHRPCQCLVWPVGNVCTLDFHGFLHESWACVVIISDPVLWNLFEPVGASQPMTLASLELFF